MRKGITSLATLPTSRRFQLIRRMATRSQSAGGNSIRSSDFRQAGWGYTTDAGIPGLSRESWKTTSFAAIPCQTPMRRGISSISAFGEHFCGDIWRSTNGGQTWTALTAEPRTAATSNGSRSIGTQQHGARFPVPVLEHRRQRFRREFSRSTDGGVTWLTPISIPNAPQWGTLDVAMQWQSFHRWRGIALAFWCVRSSNAQNPGCYANV